MNVIRVEQLVKSYGGTQALRGISFEIARGEIVGYIGPNGAGKSTTVKILMGILAPDGGRAHVDGIDVAAEPARVKAQIGYVPETGGVFEALTAREFLRFAGRLRSMPDTLIDARSAELLAYFDLAEQADAMMTTYSKGMRQKVVIASALLHDPPVYLFDEPLDGLDASSTQLFKELIRALAARGRTILYCSHLLDIVERVCTRMIVLRDGAIAAAGSIDELRARTNVHTLEDAFSVLTESEDASRKTARLLDAFAHVAT